MAFRFDRVPGLTIFGASLLLAVALIAGLNFSVDLAGLRSRGKTERLAVQQRPDQLLVSDKPFDQREWTRARLLASGCPQILILGASTLGRIRGEMFPGRTVLNAWMTGPSFEDLAGMTTLLESSGCRPSLVLVGFDPLFFNPLTQDARWRSLEKEYQAYEFRHSPLARWALGLTGTWERMKELYNYQTTRETLRYLLESRGAERAGPEELFLTSEAAPAVCGRWSRVEYIRGFDGHYASCERDVPRGAALEQLARCGRSVGEEAGSAPRRLARPGPSHRVAAPALPPHDLRGAPPGCGHSRTPFPDGRGPRVDRGAHRVAADSDERPERALMRG